ATVMSLVAGLLLAGAGAAGRLPATPPQPAEAKRSRGAADRAEAARAEAAGEVAVSGRVLDPDGRPFAGAKVSFLLAGASAGRATTDARGNFHFRIPRKRFETEDEKGSPPRWVVVGVCNGHGPGLFFASRAEQLANVTVRLVKDLPIEGRVVSLEGKPIAGARVRVREVFTQARDVEDLGLWVQALRSKKEADNRDRPGLRLDPA